MRKQITITEDELSDIKSAMEIAWDRLDEKRQFRLIRLIKRWNKAKEQKFFKKGGPSGDSA